MCALLESDQVPLVCYPDAFQRGTGRGSCKHPNQQTFARRRPKNGGKASESVRRSRCSNVVCRGASCRGGCKLKFWLLFTVVSACLRRIGVNIRRARRRCCSDGHQS